MIGSSLCWSCHGVTVSGLFCTTCHAILPMDPGVDFFHLFDMTPTYDVDPVVLEQRYRALQKQLHPDYFASRTPMERRLSLEHVTRVNEALQTLSDPMLRAGYLLERVGGKTGSSGSDPEFLQAVMEWRELLEEVNLQAADALERLAALRVEARKRLKVEEDRVAQLFRAFFAGSGQDQGSLSGIVRLVDRMRYHRRFLEEVDRLEDQAFEFANG
ncbi:MAG: Fe-S protein assembly co-chaperone HscB [Magnetococcus sp. YQC-5]